jgi:hypothetical protein
MDKRIRVRLSFKAPEGAKEAAHAKGLAGILDESPDYPLEQKYEEYNRKLFGGKLPKVRMKFAPLKGKSGMVSYQVVQPSDPKVEPPPGVIAGRYSGRNNSYVSVGSIILILSNEYHREEQSLDAIIIHEMIHIYLLINGELMENHGPKFKQTVSAIEAKVGFKIPLTDDISGLPRMTQRVLPIAVILIQYANGKWVYGITSEAIAKKRLEAIRASIELGCQRRIFTKGAVFLIATEKWFHKVAKLPAARNPEALKDLYLVDNSEALADLHDNGTMEASVDPRAATS